MNLRDSLCLSDLRRWRLAQLLNVGDGVKTLLLAATRVSACHRSLDQVNKVGLSPAQSLLTHSQGFEVLEASGQHSEHQVSWTDRLDITPPPGLTGIEVRLLEAEVK